MPFAGKISHVLFDKTGTLTTDQLVPVGVVCSDANAPHPGLSIGDPVQLHGIVSKPELNGARGFVVTAPDAASGRVTVRVTTIAQAAAGGRAASAGGKSIRGRFKLECVQPLPAAPRAMVAVGNARPAAAMVLGACHSLVSVPGSGLVGDPIEMAGLRGAGWTYDAATQTAKPGDGSEQTQAAAAISARLAKLADKAGAEAQVLKQRVKDLHAAASQAKAAAATSPLRAVRVLCRHHFSSALQRMSVVVQVASRGSTVDSGVFCLVKGSPEKLRELLGAGEPEWFQPTYRLMAERGMRVLALAYKRVSEADASSAAKQPREWVESGLTFAGFIAFECKTRVRGVVSLRCGC